MTDLKIRKLSDRTLLRKPNKENDFWRIEHIYQGDKTKHIPTAVRVPNIGDIIIDTSNGAPRWLEVEFVDEITLEPTLVELNSNVNRGGISNENKLLGVGPGYQSELFRLYLDTSVVPHIFIPDSRLIISGKENTKYKIFLGTDTSAATGKVISMNFNPDGELISEDIPLEKVAFARTDETDTNIAVKCCRRGYTTSKLQNNDVVTLVTYSDSGVITGYNVLLVHNTALDRNVEASKKYITTIGIDSPFLDKTENNTLVFPMNAPRDSLAMKGVISYSDGTSVRIPIDQNRLRLAGLDNYVPMKKDQVINLVLIYHLSDNEMALNASVGDDRFIAVKYFGRTEQVDGSYSVNLFPIPTYVSETYGWKIRYMLYTLDRDIVYDVTNIVETGANTIPLQPLLFNETQDITVSVDLSRIDERLPKFIHVQSFKIALLGHPRTGNTTSWYITYEKDQNPVYGANINCIAVKDPGLQRWRLNISCGAKNKQEWLDRVYYRTMPLTDKYVEARPPTPTHFTVIIDDTRVSYPIDAWNTTLDFPVGAFDGYGVIIQFTRVEGNVQYQLSSAPLCFMDISESGVIDHASTTETPPTEGVDPNAITSTVIDIDVEVKRILDRGASTPIADKYRQLLERIKTNGLLKYEDINTIYQRIRNKDITPAQIANDVVLLELEINKITISDFNRITETSGIAPSSMERNR